jgi:hypothetical protein
MKKQVCGQCERELWVGRVRSGFYCLPCRKKLAKAKGIKLEECKPKAPQPYRPKAKRSPFKKGKKQK